MRRDLFLISLSHNIEGERTLTDEKDESLIIEYKYDDVIIG